MAAAKASDIGPIVNSRRQHIARSPGNAGWQPRRAQEAKLRRLEALLERQHVGQYSIDTEIERAVLLGALNRQPEAQQAFVDILRRAPTHFSALNEFGTLLVNTSAFDAACRVYSEAVVHHPQNPVGHVNLANLLLRMNRHAEARQRYEAALRIDRDFAPAHQGLGAVLSDLGERDGARVHFEKGFRGQSVTTLPYRGSQPPIALLQLISSGGGNIPTASFLRDDVFLTTVVVADYLDDRTPLPAHQLIFNTIGDADLCEPALLAADRLVARTHAPVINAPAAVMATGRVANADRLRAVPDVVTPRTAVIARRLLTGPDGASQLAKRQFAFPLLLRSPGYHTGRNFVLVEQASQLSAAAAGLPGDELLAIEYLDARGADGSSRKYRVMMIAGRLYPLHLAISRDWKVHYYTSDMADVPDHRREEAQFLSDMSAVLGGKAMTALKRIQATLGLDYAGIDFGLGPNGEILLFEANATMVVATPSPDPRWAYRRGAIEGALDAIVAMIRDKAGQPARC